jgi:acetylornithine/succinyldiaminopimelate/putrescine aminotransferase
MQTRKIARRGSSSRNERKSLQIRKRLLRALLNDKASHPERGNATFERVVETVDATIATESAKKIIQMLDEYCKAKGYPIKDPREQVNERQGNAILAEIVRLNRTGKISNDNLAQIVRMLEDSDISSYEAVELHRNYKIPVSQLEEDIIPVRGKGVWIIDIRGKRYMDVDSNYSAANLGYSNAAIAKALFNQASQLITMKEDCVQVPRTRLIKTLLPILPKELDQFYWQNSGGEAVDKSLKIAKAYTKQRGVIAMTNSFHGRTHGAVAVTYNLAFREPFGLQDESWVRFLPFNDGNALEQALKEGKQKIVIMELVQGEEGAIRPAEKEYAKRARELCDQHDALLIVDEVQTGFGRTAVEEGQWWASDYYEIVPDIISIGKSYGGGFPVTSVVTKEHISKAMKPGYDGSTFGGNPLAMVSATVAVQQMKRANITRNVAQRGRQLVKGLKSIDSSLIRDIRGLGLFIGIDLPSARHVRLLQEKLRTLGINSSLSTRNTVRLMPPTIISKEEVDILLRRLGTAIRSLQ